VGFVSAQCDSLHPDSAAHKRGIISIQQKRTKSIAFAFAFAFAKRFFSFHFRYNPRHIDH